ncbi:unnamed protein product [Linum tenue]|uniref:Uncharacterized protein n=1 Tax=Linum tenue TaxID=586396 RepID=A0AAV0S362_9ROSI|nr:unnamed protein product [Linum tenue]
MLVLELPWASDSRISEKLPARCCPRKWSGWTRTRADHSAVWESGKRFVHHGLPVSHIRVPSFCDLSQ